MQAIYLLRALQYFWQVPFTLAQPLGQGIGVGVGVGGTGVMPGGLGVLGGLGVTPGGGGQLFVPAALCVSLSFSLVEQVEP